MADIIQIKYAKWRKIDLTNLHLQQSAPRKDKDPLSPAYDGSPEKEDISLLILQGISTSLPARLKPQEGKRKINKWKKETIIYMFLANNSFVKGLSFDK